MPLPLTKEGFRKRAKVARSVAGDMRDGKNKRILLELAEEYERKAQRIEAQEPPKKSDPKKLS